jgi:hypothetical protein
VPDRRFVVPHPAIGVSDRRFVVPRRPSGVPKGRELTPRKKIVMASETFLLLAR